MLLKEFLARAGHLRRVSLARSFHVSCRGYAAQLGNAAELAPWTPNIIRAVDGSAVAGANSVTSYEDYDRTSEVYDDARQAISLETLREALVTASENRGVPLAEIRAIDFGCGTGNYLSALLQMGVGNVVGMDMSYGMLNQCAGKLAREPTESPGSPESPPSHGTVELVRGSMVSAKETVLVDRPPFDVAIVTQALHHLVTGDDADIRLQATALGNICSCLAPGGMLYVQTTLPEQIHDGFWWRSHIIPDAMGRLQRRMPELAFLRQVGDLGWQGTYCFIAFRWRV